MSKHVIHKHSSQVVEGAPKLVSPSELEYGELALNYAKGNETLMFKNNQNEIVTFSPKDNENRGVGQSYPNSISGEIFNNYYANMADGDYSHAEGDSTAASGYASHAEGWGTFAAGDHSHSEGYRGMAIGTSSHAEGSATTASGKSSHAEGDMTCDCFTC